MELGIRAPAARSQPRGAHRLDHRRSASASSILLLGATATLYLRGELARYPSACASSF